MTSSCASWCAVPPTPPCYGAYTDRPHYMIYTTLTHREALQLQAFIHKENLNAFISMLSTTEVFGKGFNHA